MCGHSAAKLALHYDQHVQMSTQAMEWWEKAADAAMQAGIDQGQALRFFSKASSVVSFFSPARSGLSAGLPLPHQKCKNKKQKAKKEKSAFLHSLVHLQAFWLWIWISFNVCVESKAKPQAVRHCSQLLQLAVLQETEIRCYDCRPMHWQPDWMSSSSGMCAPIPTAPTSTLSLPPGGVLLFR